LAEEIKNELLNYGLDDLLDLGWVIQVTGRHIGVSPIDPAVVEPTLRVVTEMLEAGHLVAGPTGRNREDLLYVRSWGLSPKEAVDRIRKDWSAIDGLPTPGQIAWFELTDAGRAAAEQMSR
jgi:hypothetical protein